MTVDPLYIPPGLATRLDDVSSSSQDPPSSSSPSSPVGRPGVPPQRTSRSELLAELSLVHLYTAACLYQWDALPSLAAQVHAHALPEHEPGARVQACVRHLVVFCGYGPCLAAMTALKKVEPGMLERTIPYDTPGKVSRSFAAAGVDCDAGDQRTAGNAFQLVYSTLSPKVRNTVYQADPVLENWIQNHLYGDVYSSPGLGMLTKQHLTIAGLVKSNMMEQLYGHALAALRFGGEVEVLKGIVDIVVWWQQRVGGVGSGEGGERARDLERQGTKSKRVIDMAVVKYERMAQEGALETDDVVVNPPGTVCIPELN